MSTANEELGLHVPIGSKRNVLQWIIGLCAAVIGVSLAVPLTRYVISPAFTRRSQSWVDIGKVEDLKIGEPKELERVMTVKDGWMETKDIKSVWAVKQPDGQVTVFSPICPHLGCGYRWDQVDHKFKCPCHGSVFSLTGQVLSGPAPRPLDVLPEKVENGRISVIYRQFRAGLPTRVVI